MVAVPKSPWVYVVNESGNSVIPFDATSGKAVTSVAVGHLPTAVAASPDGRMVYVANDGSDSVTPIDASTRSAGAAIPVGVAPDAIAVSSDSRSVFVGNENSDSLTPISVSGTSGRPGTEIPLGMAPTAMASGSGSTVYVGGVATRTNAHSELVAVTDGRVDSAPSPLVLPGEPVSMALTSSAGVLLVVGIEPPAAPARSAQKASGKAGHTTTTTAPQATSSSHQPRGYVAAVSLGTLSTKWVKIVANEVTAVAIPAG